MQCQSSCAPKLARKCEIGYWFPCDDDGRAGGHVIIKWVDSLTHSAPQARFARQSSANNDCVADEIGVDYRYDTCEITCE